MLEHPFARSDKQRRSVQLNPSSQLMRQDSEQSISRFAAKQSSPLSKLVSTYHTSTTNRQQRQSLLTLMSNPNAQIPMRTPPKKPSQVEQQVRLVTETNHQVAALI